MSVGIEKFHRSEISPRLLLGFVDGYMISNFNKTTIGEFSL